VTAALTLDGLGRAYGRVAAVDGVCLQLARGERHALIGHNGAGKSTLLALVAGTVRPSTGRILLGARDVTRTRPHRRAVLGLGRTFQQPAVFATLTVQDNVRLAAWRHGARRSPAYLEALGLGAHAQKAAGALSHGQRRLLEIAMVLSGRPSVLLLDEPAAGLGDDDLTLLLGALRRLPDDMAVLLVEHNQDLVQEYAEVITVLHHGRVLASGSPARIAADPAVAEVYLG